MTIFRLALLVVVVGKTMLWAHASVEYADHLFATGDYYRAISLYKQVTYGTVCQQTRTYCAIQIAKAYYHSEKYRGAVVTLERLMADQMLSPQIQRSTHLYLGLSHYKQGEISDAERYLKLAVQDGLSGLSGAYLGLVLAEQGKWAESAERFATTGISTRDPEVSAACLALGAIAPRGREVRRKSPLVAGLLSAVIPGSGQVYTGHYFDAVQALFFVAGLGLGTIGLYQVDGPLLGITGTAITGLFHFSNVLGARTTAQYQNLRKRDQFLWRLRERVFTLGPQLNPTETNSMR
jgi:tetratricopeptide (TPR) repeat protein